MGEGVASSGAKFLEFSGVRSRVRWEGGSSLHNYRTTKKHVLYLICPNIPSRTSLRD